MMKLNKMMSTLVLTSVLVLSACSGDKEETDKDVQQSEFGIETNKESTEKTDKTSEKETEQVDKSEPKEETDKDNETESDEKSDKVIKKSDLNTLNNIHKDVELNSNQVSDYNNQEERQTLVRAIGESLHRGSIASNVQLDNFKNYLETMNVHVDDDTMDALRNIVGDDEKVLYNTYIDKLAPEVTYDKDTNVYTIRIGTAFLPVKDKPENEEDEIKIEETMIENAKKAEVGADSEEIYKGADFNVVWYTLHLNKDKSQGTLHLENKEWYNGQNGDYFGY